MPKLKESAIQATLAEVGENIADTPLMLDYAERHGIAAQPFLTVVSDEIAGDLVEYLYPRIEGKTVVEIGGGIGLLSLHMGFVAKQVICFEANPLWGSIFIAKLLAVKPKNVSYILGSAQEFVGKIQADVAIVATHSGLEFMKDVAGQFAPVVIDVYGEIIASNPAAFDKFAAEARRFA